MHIELVTDQCIGQSISVEDAVIIVIVAVVLVVVMSALVHTSLHRTRADQSISVR